MRSRLLILALVALPAAASAWGFTGHRRLASVLHEPLPQGHCLRAWLQTVTGTFAWQDKSCDPDRWRNNDPTSCEQRTNAELFCEWPRHYLDIDYANPAAGYPREWPEVEVRFGQYAVANGRVPWIVEQFHAQLVQELKDQNGTKALETIAFLSHYVTDASSPMHATKSQPGNLHTRYESDMLSSATRRDAITLAMRDHYGAVGRADPRHHTFDVILTGLPLSQQLISEDFAAGGDATALYESSKEMTARRWADAVILMTSLVGTAWVEAGSPLLPGMPAGCDATFPETPLQLAGYPLDPLPDADGGVDAGDGGGGGGGHVIPHPPGDPVGPPLACGCAGASGAALAIPGLLALFFLARRGRRAR